MKHTYIRPIIISALLAFGFAGASAVTDSEMEQARAITAKIYLRWANNGSDYLDTKNPATLAELESSLKETEKKNLTAFKAVAMPRDYASWDKEKLVDYWSNRFFASKGLNEDGSRQGARNQIKKRLQAMQVSAPAPATSASAAPEEPAASAAQSAADSAAAAGEAEARRVALAANAQKADSISERLAAAEEEVAEVETKKSSGTWIYIVVLAILVGAVIWLVVFASKTLRQGGDSANGGETARRASRRDEAETITPAPHSEAVGAAAASSAAVAAPAAPAASEDTARMREKFAQTLAARQEEIRLLNRRILDLSTENDTLVSDNATLREENARLRRDNERLQTAALRPAAPAAPEAPRTPSPSPAPSPAAAAAPAPRSAAATQQSESREIYLGRVNNRGIFVRADRTLNPGSSVYCLTTTDGYSGSFRVVSDPDSVQTALDNPQEWLAGGCVAKDLTDTVDRTAIVTETAGTAIFEGGTWRVIRKARVRYV